MNFFILDPRPAVRDAQIAGLTQYAPVLGVEVTVPALAAACAANVDPQHDGSGNAAYAAIEQVIRDLDELSRFETVVTVRADLDSIGSMAAISLYQGGIDIRQNDAAMERISRIAQHDKFAFGPWRGQSLNEDEIDWEIRAIGSLVSDSKRPAGARVAATAAWLASGELPEGLMDDARRTWRAAIENTTVSAEDGIAVIVSAHRFASEIGYALAPVMVASNPAFPGPDGPVLKHTVAQWKGEHKIDMEAILADLRRLEAGWGGNVANGVIGSPQGVSSTLTQEQVVQVVRSHLIFEYESWECPSCGAYIESYPCMQCGWFNPLGG